jgi:ABC-type transport system substrate-binding protein
MFIDRGAKGAMHMPSDYWARVTQDRISRRRAILATGGAALGAAFLAACGGGDEGSKDSGSLIAKPVDTTDKAKQGGVLKSSSNNDSTHYDALLHNGAAVVNAISVYAYSRVLRFVTPRFPERATGELEGDLASSFELGADKLQVTFKIRDGVKWDPRSPTNGRLLDAQDVVWSWDKFAAVNPAATNLANKRSPLAPVDTVTAIDNKTVVMKLKTPDASLLPLFAAFDHFFVMPRESESGFDPKTVIRGNGPWRLDEHVPSGRFVWARNPDYHIKGRPFPDKLERPILPEYSSRLAQFRAGQVWTSVANANDIVQTKRDLPATVLLQADTHLTSNSNYISFGWDGNAPGKDLRVRQAVSMLVDREAYSDALYNRDRFLTEGIEVETAFHTIVPAGWAGWYIDPRDEKKFGENAKLFKHNVPEAKKLLAAAGFANGFETTMPFTQTVWGDEYIKSAELLAGMMLDGGIKVTLNGMPYEIWKDTFYSAYVAEKFTASGGNRDGYNGLFAMGDAGFPTIAAALFGTVHKDGARYHGLSPDGKNPHQGDPKLNSDIMAIKEEFDREKQQAMVQDLVRYFSGQSYYVPRASSTKGLDLSWPAIGNLGVYQSSPGAATVAERDLHYWVDPTKAPLA